MKIKDLSRFRSNELVCSEMEVVKGGAWWSIVIEIALIIIDDPESFGKGMNDGCSCS